MIKKIILASHGTLAEGIYKAASIILGSNQLKNTEYLNCYVDETKNVYEDIEQIVERCDEHTLVFTDMFGGSVNNIFYSYLDRKKFTLVTGMNLPVVIDALLFQDDIKEYEKHLNSLSNEFIKLMHTAIDQEEEEFE